MGKENRIAQETHAIKLRLYKEKNTVLVYGKDVSVELQGQVFRTAFPPSTSSNKCNRKCNQTSVAGYNVTQQTSAPNKSRKAERPKEDL